MDAHVEAEDHVGVRGDLGGLQLHSKPAGHSQVDEQMRAIVEISDAPLPPAAYLRDAPADDQLRPARLPGVTQLALADPQSGQRSTDQVRPEVADDGLDFRQ